MASACACARATSANASRSGVLMASGCQMSTRRRVDRVDGVPYVAVIGPSEATADEAARAEEVGRLLAARGALVVCGGLGGVMEAVARGAGSAGGAVLGIPPGRQRGGAHEH